MSENYITIESRSDYYQLYIFGSDVYVMYNTEEVSKLDSKSRKYVFLGYVDGVKGYHLWDPTTHKVVINKDVIFVEDKMQMEKNNNILK